MNLLEALVNAIRLPELRNKILFTGGILVVFRLFANVAVPGASQAALAAGVRAATDVTGFGLLGHLHRMLAASGVAARIDAAAVPLLPGAAELAAAGFVSGGTRANTERMRGFAVVDPAVAPELAVLLHDAQTSGGLLLAAPPAAAAALLDELRAQGLPAALIGDVMAGDSGHVDVYPARSE